MCEVVIFSMNKTILGECHSPTTRQNCFTIYFWNIKQKRSTNPELWDINLRVGLDPSGSPSN